MNPGECGADDRFENATEVPWRYVGNIYGKNLQGSRPVNFHRLFCYHPPSQGRDEVDKLLFPRMIRADDRTHTRYVLRTSRDMFARNDEFLGILVVGAC